MHRCSQDSIFSAFSALPPRGKPRPLTEWTVLAGFTISTAPVNHNDSSVFQSSHSVVALATGSKCLGLCDKRIHGLRVNDCHAEILARRALRLRILREIEAHIDAGCCASSKIECQLAIRSSSMTSSNTDDIINTPHLLLEHSGQHVQSDDLPHVVNNSGPEDVNSSPTMTTFSTRDDRLEPSRVPAIFRFRRDLRLHLFISDSPCGEAAEYNDKDEEEIEDGGADVVEYGCKDELKPTDQTVKFNVSSYHKLGVGVRKTGAKLIRPSSSSPNMEPSTCGLRIKPGRTDLPIERITTSMSCSDKVMRWTAVGVQGSILAHFLDRPIMLHSITVANEHIGGDSSSSSSSSSSSTSSSSSSMTTQLSALQRALISRCSSARAASSLIFTSSLPYLSTEDLAEPSITLSPTRFPLGRGGVLSSLKIGNASTAGNSSSSSSFSSTSTLADAVRSRELGGSGSGALIVPCGASIVAFFSGDNNGSQLFAGDGGAKKKRKRSKEESVEGETSSRNIGASMGSILDSLSAIEVLTSSTGELHGATKSADADRKASIICKARIYETFKRVWKKYSVGLDRGVGEEKCEEKQHKQHVSYHDSKRCDHGTVNIYRRALDAFHNDSNRRFSSWSFASPDFEKQIS